LAFSAIRRDLDGRHFKRGLRDLGQVEGQNIAIEWRWTEGKLERAAELAMDLVRLKVDVIVASAPPATRTATSMDENR
jgi:putative ABC transport system substrate-binding protein